MQSFFKNYNLTSLDVYNGLSQVHCIKPKEESIIIMQRVLLPCQIIWSPQCHDSRFCQSVKCLPELACHKCAYTLLQVYFTLIFE